MHRGVAEDAEKTRRELRALRSWRLRGSGVAGAFRDRFCVRRPDGDGKVRIDAATRADVEAYVRWVDRDRKFRITVATLADGSVLLPTRDLTQKP